MDSAAEPLHIVFFPALVRSHMMAMLETARLFAERGVRATVVTTQANARLLRPTIDRHNSSISTNNSSAAGASMELLLIPFSGAEYGIPDGCENHTDVPFSLIPKFYEAQYNALPPALDSLLAELRPDTVVSDGFYPWTTEVAAAHGIPRLSLQLNGFLAQCVINDFGVYRLQLEEACRCRDVPFTIPAFPQSLQFTPAQLPEYFYDAPFLLDHLVETERTSYGAIVNSFYELEPDFAEHYYKAGPRKVFGIGPVSIAGNAADKPSHLQQSDDKCIAWLDGKPERSVLYVNFGSLSRFTEEQLRELAMGLESSGCAFLWVVAKEFGNAWIPEGFEQRVADRGFVERRWVPQKEILVHRATAVFLTHCGWNSVLEGVCAGVPLLTWPLHSEQFLAEILITDLLNIGWPAWNGFKSTKDDEKVLVPAAAVASAVSKMKDPSEEVELRRRRVQKLAEAARTAVAEGGSSHSDLSRIIEELMALRSKRGKKQQ